MELLEKQLELNNEIRAKEELQRECTQTRQQLTETETYVHTPAYQLCVFYFIRELTMPWIMYGLFGRAGQFKLIGFCLRTHVQLILLLLLTSFILLRNLAISESKNDQLEKEVEVLKQELLQARQAGNKSIYTMIT